MARAIEYHTPRYAAKMEQYRLADENQKSATKKWIQEKKVEVKKVEKQIKMNPPKRGVNPNVQSVIYGLGPNGLALPLVVCDNQDAALDLLISLKLSVQETKYKIGCGVELENNKTQTKKIIKKLFKGYYGGCGECSSLFIEPLEIGKPMTLWDLD